MSADHQYDTYLQAIEMIAQSTFLPIRPMTRLEFDAACAESDYIHRSVINMDAFEATMHRVDALS